MRSSFAAIFKSILFIISLCILSLLPACFGAFKSATSTDGPPHADSDPGVQRGQEKRNVAAVATWEELALIEAHACARDNLGRVKCWGVNSVGQLGLGDVLSRGAHPNTLGKDLPFIDLGRDQRAITVSNAAPHSCALLQGGKVKCWGLLNWVNPLARGDTPGEMGDDLPFINLGSGRTAVSLTAGWWSTCAILDDGSAKCWGLNENGQLGQGHLNSPVGLTESGMGDNLARVNIGTGRSVLQISPGFKHSCALLDNHSVKCWGDNSAGQLGSGNNVSTHSAGDSIPAVNLGVGRTAKQVLAGSAYSCAILDDGSVKCWGFLAPDNFDPMGDLLQPIDLGLGRTAASLSGGATAICAILDNGTLKCWGFNDGCQLGLGTAAGQGAFPRPPANLPAIDLGANRTAFSVKVGQRHTCALLDDKTIKCWGNNDDGRLGLGDSRQRGCAAAEMGSNLPSLDLGL